MHAGRVIGHRGAPRVATENTLESFRAAARFGVRWVETDIALLGDGTAVMSHDSDLRHIAGRPEKLSEIGAADLAPLGVADRLPTLAAALATFEDLGLAVNLEIKVHGDDAAPVVAAAIKGLAASRLPVSRLLISSFSVDALERVRAARADLPIGILCDAPPADWKETAKRLSALAIHPNHKKLTAADVVEIRAAGCEVYTYTVNEPADAMRLWGWGVSGIFTDDPALMLGLTGAAA